MPSHLHASQNFINEHVIQLEWNEMSVLKWTCGFIIKDSNKKAKITALYESKQVNIRLLANIQYSWREKTYCSNKLSTFYTPMTPSCPVVSLGRRRREATTLSSCPSLPGSQPTTPAACGLCIHSYTRRQKRNFVHSTLNCFKFFTPQCKHISKDHVSTVSEVPSRHSQKILRCSYHM